jgi:hypothetical protein
MQWQSVEVRQIFLTISEMSKYLQNKKVNTHRKRLQSERRMIEASKKAPVTAAERM